MPLKYLYKSLFLLFLGVTTHIVFAQNPIYYTIGKNELNDADIYSILEAENGDVYISSDKGLFRYRNGTFFKFSQLKNQKGSSLFSLVKTTSGAIFCSNLKGQIFKVYNNRLELFYTIPNAFLTYFPYLLTDTKDNLLVVSKRIDVLTSKGNLVDTISGFDFVEKNINGQIVIKNSNTNYYYLLSEKEKQYPLPFNIGETKQYYKKSILSRNLVGAKTQAYHFDMNDNLAIDKTHNSVLIYNSSIYLNKLRTYGVQEIILENNTLKKGNLFFKNTFISSFAKGENATLYLGTFKQGLRVIPNYNFTSVKTAEKPRSIVDFDVRNDDEIYLHIRGKGLKCFDNRTQKTVLVQDNYTNQDVFCSSNIKFQHSIDFPDVFIQSSEKNIGFGGVKDITPVTNIGFLVATSEGLLFEGDINAFKNINPSKSMRKRLNRNAVFLALIDERCTAVRYHQKSETIYVATQSKLLTIAKGVVSEIKHQNQSIIANSLVLVNDVLFIGSQRQGVLKCQNNTLEALYDKSNGLADNSVKKIAIKDHYLFVLSPDFLQYINLETNKINPLNKGEGVIGYINEFHLSENKLWVLTDNTTIMTMELSQLQKFNTKLRFKMDSLQVNNTVVATVKENDFSHHQNNFNFFFHLKNDSYREQTSIKYRLKGFDDTYNSIPATIKNISYKKLPSGTYTFNAYAQYGTIKSDEFNYTFTITPPFWETWWFRLLCIVAGVILIFLVFKYRLKKQEEKAKEKLKQQKIQTDLIDAKLTAIRTQMNPHFIFNSINSIQDLVLQNESLKTYDSLVLFSQLVRNSLEYSEKELITLEEEKEFINVYLSLEKLRFKDNFSFAVTVNGNKDVFIPSLIIQPFVENAIKHGLLHSNKEKHLSVHFEVKEHLICTIIDNGIGRVASKKIKERKKEQHNSFSTRAIKKRLKILEEKLKTSCTVTIIDLVDTHNLPQGTEVIVTLPILTKEK